MSVRRISHARPNSFHATVPYHTPGLKSRAVVLDVNDTSDGESEPSLPCPGLGQTNSTAQA